MSRTFPWLLLPAVPAPCPRTPAGRGPTADDVPPQTDSGTACTSSAL